MNARVLAGTALALAVSLTALAVWAETKTAACPATKAEKVTLTGRLSCTFCTLAHPEKSCSKECCVSCVKAGDPPTLKDAEGNLFLLLTGEKGVALMTPANLELVGTQVTVTGMKVACKGLQAIYVESIVKADEKK